MKEEAKVLSYWGHRGDLSRCGKNSWLIKKGREKYRLLRRDAGDGFAMSEAAVRCYLADRGFSYQPRLCLGEDGAVARRDNSEYLSEHWSGAGRFPFDDGYHVIEAARVLGEFRNIMMDFDWREHGFPIKEMLHRPRRLEQMLETGERCQSSFRHLLPQEEMEDILSRGKRSLSVLSGPLYEKVSGNILRNGGVAYRAIRRRGLMLHHGEPLLTDFSRLSEDLPVVDLWQLLRRYFSYEGSRGEVIQSAITAYEAPCPLAIEEKNILIQLLCFPYVLLRNLERLEKDKANDRLRRETVHILRAEHFHKNFYRELEKEGSYENCH
ncbi:MAG TPA: hypothetical protein H9669_02600 [Firmicutes bacterium]|nr:hypothetical protein [Bacillota bacterium]